MNYTEILEPIIHSPILPRLREELERFWIDEQIRRKEFYEYISPKDKAEYIHGDIIIHSPVSYAHNRIGKKLIRLLDEYVEENKIGGYLGYEKILCRFMRNDYEPDICYFSEEKAKNFKDNQNIFPVPNFIIEILYNSTEKNDLEVKFNDYAYHGIEEYWIIDPENQIVEQYILEDSQYKLKEKLSSGKLNSSYFLGFTIDVDEVFS